MDRRYSKRIMGLIVTVFSLSVLFGCSGMEVNTKQDKYPYHYIHKELQEADRAVEAARAAGKDKQCPAEFKAAEELRDRAYAVYAACHTQEGIALAKEATTKANALCPARTGAKPEPKAVEPVIVLVAEPKAEEKVLVAAVEPKLVILAFEDVHFDFDKSTLKQEAQALLKRNIQLLKDNPKAKIRIAGYTSASGSEEYNQKLSERRASAVRDYLIKENVVTPERLSIIGYGEHDPERYEAAPAELYSEAAKANMRVLFEIILK
jgi:outer membrane protein OmpA-like peptidoglycan-associated protein